MVYSAHLRSNRTARLHHIMTDNAGLSVVLPMAGRMADRIDQNPENIANKDVAGSPSGGHDRRNGPETLGFCSFSRLVGWVSPRFAGGRRPVSLECEQHSKP